MALYTSNLNRLCYQVLILSLLSAGHGDGLIGDGRHPLQTIFESGLTAGKTGRSRRKADGSSILNVARQASCFAPCLEFLHSSSQSWHKNPFLNWTIHPHNGSSTSTLRPIPKPRPTSPIHRAIQHPQAAKYPFPFAYTLTTCAKHLLRSVPQQPKHRPEKGPPRKRRTR